MLIRQPGERWRVPATTHYTDEAALQALLAESPELLPDVPSDGVLVARELSIPGAGYLDVAVVGLDASLTLVECKLAANPEIRRAVVGQIFAYASGMWRMHADDLDAAWRASNKGTGLRLGAEHLASGRDVDQEPFDGTLFMQRIGDNLAAGRMRLVVAVDTITTELRRIIEFLNDRTQPELQVIALELDYVADSGVEMLIPSVYGVEVARQKSASRGTKTTEESFLAALDNWCTPHTAAAVRRLLDHTREHAAFDHLYWGEGKDPSVTAVYNTPHGQIQAWSLYTGPDGRTMWAPNFDWIYKDGTRLPEATVRQFRDRLADLPGAATRFVDVEARRWKARPSLPAEPVFSAPSAVETITSALDALLHP